MQRWPELALVDLIGTAASKMAGMLRTVCSRVNTAWSMPLARAITGGGASFSAAMPAIGATALAVPRTGPSLHAPIRGLLRKNQRGLKVVEPIELETTPRIGLDSIAPVPGAVRDKIRAGRGRSGRRGKTAGRGHKGSGQRNRVAPWFQGGQTPVWQKWPKRGRPATDPVKYAPLNIGTLVNAIKAGKLDPSYPIDMRHLWRARVVTGSVKALTADRWGVKLLGSGADQLDFPITIEVQRASAKAIEAVENAGGKISCKYYAPLNLKALLMPHKFASIPRIPLPVPKRQRWYLNPENRGVLTEVDAVNEKA